jgi:pyruvate dehydrogenase E2 component (dihydrolipoamide acetyltransferase)
MAEVMMPRLGVSVTEGTLSTWLKQVGDEVAVGEPICEVATDKVDTEIESTAAGILTEQRYAEGDVVPVGEPLAVVAGADEAPAPAPEPEPERGPEPEEPAAEPAGPTGEGLVRLPHLGVSVTEATVSTWLKQVGDPVEVGEPLCEVSTDKVDTEIESTVAGILAEQRYAEGDTSRAARPSCSR